MFEVTEGKETIGNVSALVKAAEVFSAEHDSAPVLLRGHFDASWTLTPTLGRPFSYNGDTKLFDRESEVDFVQRFIRHSYPTFGRTLGPWEAYLLARQHGLPVRLLDWAGNPLVALYFAVNSDGQFSAAAKSVPCAVWALARKKRDHTFIDVLKGDPMSVMGVKVIYPLAVSPRLIAQGGVYTIQPHETMPLDQYAQMDIRPEGLDILALRRWKIAGKSKPALLRELHRVNVDQRTLFPDLDGIARSIWQDKFFGGARQR